MQGDRCWLVLGLVLASHASARAQQTLTQADLLQRIVQLDRLWAAPAGEQSGLFSSSDRQANLDANGHLREARLDDDCGHFLRAEADGWHVAAEVEGPGALTRIWCAVPAGHIRFLLDDQPALELPCAELFNGQAAPFQEPLCTLAPASGGTCYVPIGFTRRCRVLLNDPRACYEISYTRFPAGTSVQTFTRELDDAAQAARAAVEQTLYAGYTDPQLFGGRKTYTLGDAQELKAGAQLSLESFGGGGILRALYVGFLDARLPTYPYALHHCVLRIYFDGQAQPAVEAPLVDFFGSGFELLRFRSLPLGTEQWTTMPGKVTSEDPNKVTHESRFLYCHWPMPFSDTARIEITAPASLPRGRDLGVRVVARVEKQEVPADALRFHARFRRENPSASREYPVLRAGGPGRIVGTVLNVDCPRASDWTAGDLKAWVDGAGFPAWLGVGSGAFVGSTTGIDPVIQPLHGLTRAGTFGKRSGYRWLLPDCLNFERSVELMLEDLPGSEPGETYYSSVVYWYAPADDDARAALFPPLTPEVLTPPPLRIPGAVEIEGRVRGEGWGRELAEKFANGDELSNHVAATITTEDPVEIALPAERARRVRLGLRVHQRGVRVFDTIEVFDAAGGLIGTVKYDRESNSIYLVGETELQAGENVFTVRCNANATLDCWIVEDIETAR